MKLLEATYWAKVNNIEDSIAHLAEHCILSQIVRRAAKAGLPFFDCYATTTQSAIIFDLSVYNNKTAKFIDQTLASLKPCPQADVTNEINRIEIEDGVAMSSDCNVDEIYNAVNQVIVELRFKPWAKKGNPELDISNKPVNNLLHYGLPTRIWTLTIKAQSCTDESKVIIDTLASLYMRKPYIYALGNSAKNGCFEYRFRTKTDCTAETLRNDLNKVITLSQSDEFCSMIKSNNLWNESVKLIMKSLKFQVGPYSGKH